MLKGFNYLLTPKERSTLKQSPPWYYSSGFLTIEFWSDPASATVVLPLAWDPDPAAKGHGSACFYNWQFSGADEEYLDLGRCQYRELFLWSTPCSLRQGHLSLDSRRRRHSQDVERPDEILLGSGAPEAPPTFSSTIRSTT